jgi:ribosomal protein S13
MSQEYRHILRIMGTDMQGTLKTVYALTGIKGVSLSLSSAILKKAGVNPDVRVGFLTETEINKIEEIIKEPTKYSLPNWFLTDERMRKQEKTSIS